jgi:hypothetical protein
VIVEKLDDKKLNEEQMYMKWMRKNLENLN